MRNNIIEQYQNNAYGVHAENPTFVREMKTVKSYYDFYEGRPEYQLDDTIEGEFLEKVGQLWEVDKEDYTPTREIRNLTKQLIDKQARFMFGLAPTILMKPFKPADKDLAEGKRTLIEQIFDDIDFWANVSTAFKDSTIGKRVLMMVIVSPNNVERPLGVRFYTMPEFTYVMNPQDITKLLKVQIVYQDESTIGQIAERQIWYRYTYEMRDKYTIDEQGQQVASASCWCKYERINGNNVILKDIVKGEDEQGQVMDLEVEAVSEWDTLLDEIPARVIFNGGLTGDINGKSDVKDLMDMANSYNQTNSDFKDAIKFKMFEQPVFIDADDESVAGIKIAPNVAINLKTDPAIGTGTESQRAATVTSLGSTFNFQPAVDSYLDRLKKDMYEFMDQPLPEQLKEVPSGKALGFLFYDLMGRCDNKYTTTWSPAIKWLIKFMCKCISKFRLYPEQNGFAYAECSTNIIIQPNYRIPKDEEVVKDIAIKEVQANVKSHKTYIREFGNVEDEELEWAELMEEMDELNNSNNTGLMDINGEEPPFMSEGEE